MSDFSMNPSDSSDALQSFQKHLHEQYGLYFSDDKLYSLKNKIHRRIRDIAGVESIVEYSQYLQEHNEEIHKFLDEVSTNKTAFFRESVHFDHMKEILIPERSGRSDPIAIWSAACSTGPEPYSASMVLHDQTDESYKILASDLSRDALRQARRAVYPEREYEKVRSYDPRYIRYLDPYEEHQCEVINPITDPVLLRKFNLKTNPFPLEPATFDVIFCRNVMIYFNDPMIEQIVGQFTRCLRPGGYLYTGRTEPLGSIDHSLKKIDPSIYQKTKHVN